MDVPGAKLAKHSRGGGQHIHFNRIPSITDHYLEHGSQVIMTLSNLQVLALLAKYHEKILQRFLIATEGFVVFS